MSDCKTTQLKLLFETYVIENEKFLDGSKDAGRRARLALSEISKLAKARRAEIQEIKNSKSSNMRATR